MTKELIPELHDVLKLTTLKHNFSDFDKFLSYSPKTRTWDGVLQHHCSSKKEEFPAYPTDIETFLLHLADGMAAGFSRHNQSYEGESSFILHKLWNPSSVNKDTRLDKEEEIIKLLSFYAKDPTFNELIAKYGNVIRSRPEDAHAGMNITSLHSHLVLTGKFYRLFKNSSFWPIDAREVEPDVKKISALRDNKVKTWQIYLARCRFHFNQKPFRVRDMNVFELLQENMSKIQKEFYDNILFASSDEILICYDDPSVLQRICSIARDSSLWTTTIWTKKTIEQMNGEIKQKRKPDPRLLTLHKVEHIYEKLPAHIKPPICEICQMAPADKVWPTDYLLQYEEEIDDDEAAIENLCTTCFSIRNRPSRLKKLKRWTETENTSIIWIKINLDYELLTNTLEELYSNYLSKTNPKAGDSRAEVRFSLIFEFQHDYNEFLVNFRNSLLKTFSGENVEIVLDEMYCLKAQKTNDVFKILDLINIHLDSFFPEFKKLMDGPIKFSIVSCNSKFPFFEIWKNIEAQISNLQISLIGRGKIETSLMYLDQLLLASEKSYRKSALFKLAQISKLSEKLAELKFNDSSEKADFKSYEVLKRNLLPLGMDFEGILTFAKLVED